jgi:hypothetical protein
MRRLETVAGMLALGLAVLALASCGPGAPTRAESLKASMEDAAMSVPGIASAQVHVNMNTSGNFITAKLVGTGSDEATLAKALEGALPAMLEKTENLQSGTFSTTIFSSDNAVSVGADALGYQGGTALKDFREFFLNRP